MDTLSIILISNVTKLVPEGLIHMSTRYNDGSHYENHQRAAELEDIAAHAHRVAEQQGKQDHLSGAEQSRHAAEHLKNSDHNQTGTTVGHGIASFGHADIAARAYELWQERGCPDGSAEEDWHQAARELRARAESHSS